MIKDKEGEAKETAEEVLYDGPAVEKRRVSFDVPPEEVDALFDSWDPDGSGELELEEVHKQLRQHVELNPALLPGAKGEIVAQAQNKIALRKQKVDAEKATRLQGLDIDEGSDKSVADQIRDALAKNFLRVIDRI